MRVTWARAYLGLGVAGLLAACGGADPEAATAPLPAVEAVAVGDPSGAAQITATAAGLQASTALHPLGRLGEPDEIAAALAWLLDPAQGWVTGQVLGVDGGLGTVRSR